ncbi:Protein CBG05227 [Caenorhabditis briggsae]|uniref:Protein CBG05227 n=1 Tax=Caenorhabditis briggsae TaxID=6238 RepID=A8WZF5_CAEBR|nr:Protein CBG05227 [Caenorhabditis briggsae]CAP25765.2 Protein CBG05227 [Caenorhabditis briggsae]
MHKNHHKQLFKTLMLQITVPSIFEIELSLPTEVLLSGFSLYPAADSIMVMYIVSEYRNKIKRDCDGLEVTLNGRFYRNTARFVEIRVLLQNESRGTLRKPDDRVVVTWILKLWKFIINSDGRSSCIVGIGQSARQLEKLPC